MNEYERYGEYAQQIARMAPAAGRGANVKFLLIGMGIGVATALLLAPMSGRDLRNVIRRGSRTTLDGIGNQTRNLREQGSKLLGFTRRRTASETQYLQGEGI
jgi:gas vesicle protein